MQVRRLNSPFLTHAIGMRRIGRARALLCAGAFVALAGCSTTEPRAFTASGGDQTSPACAPSEGPKPEASANSQTAMKLPTLAQTTPVDYPGVHHVVAYADGIYSGAAPEGPDAFTTLRTLGIRTIVSVDGAAPDVDRAKAAGLRYVHLPIGYNGMSHERTLEIARAVRDLPGPVYIHCHHGKHRSAGAAGAAVVTLGKGTSAEMLERMKISGTAANYTGLFKCVNIATVASAFELNQASADFPEVWKTTGLVKSMVEIDEIYDHLKAIEKAGWITPADHPDLVPAAEAGRLADLFRNLQDDDRVKRRGEEMVSWCRKDSELVEQIEAALAEADPKSGRQPDGARLGGLLKTLGTSCKDCHAKYRDQ